MTGEKMKAWTSIMTLKMETLGFAECMRGPITWYIHVCHRVSEDMERQSAIKFEAVWLPEEEAAEQAKQDGRVDDSFLQKRYASTAPTPVLVPPLPARLSGRKRPPSKNNCPSRSRKRKAVCECAMRRKQMCSEYDTLKVELLKTEIYFRKLQALKLERELGLLPSEFTQRVYHQGSDEETMSAPSPIIFPDDL